VNVAQSEFLELKGNPQTYQKAAPESRDRIAIPQEPVQAEVNQNHRPGHEDFIRLDKSELIEQQDKAQQ
jgi:hypothetical protein